MKDAWLSSCASTIQDFVENATRLEPDTLTLKTQEYVNFNYSIKLELSFRIDIEHCRQAGSVRASEHLYIFTSEAQYRQAIQNAHNTVYSRQQTLHDLEAYVRSHSYGQLHQETTVYSHPTDLALIENCDACRGCGHIDCSKCRGSGKIQCHQCGGQRKILAPRTVRDQHGYQVRIEHNYRDCPLCTAMGYLTCPSCRGLGNTACTPCEGTGNLTLISRLQCVAIPHYSLSYYQQDVPDYIKDGLNKAGVAQHAYLGDVKLVQASIDDAHHQITFIYDTTVPFALMNSPFPEIGKQDIHWTVYGKSPQILDAGNVIERMLRHDLNQLALKAKKRRHLNPFVALASRKTVREFMASEVHQEMLAANQRGISGNVLRGFLNRSISTSYLSEALSSLKSIFSAVQRWAVIKWVFIGTLLGYLLTPLHHPVHYQYKLHAWSGARQAYISPVLHWKGWEGLLSSLMGIARYSGFFLVILAIIVSISGHLWQRWHFKRRFGIHAYRWARSKGILRNRWISSSLCICVTTWGLLLFFPVWITEKGLLFGKLPLTEAIFHLLSVLHIV